MHEKREKLYNKRIGTIEAQFLSIHKDQLLEKGLIPAIDSIKTLGEETEETPSKNKFDIYQNEQYKEAVADMKEKYFSGHYICP